MLVSIVKDWDSPNILRQTPGQSGEWGGVKFVVGHRFFADVLVVLNAPSRNCFGAQRQKGRWLMSQEPPHEFYKWQTKYYEKFDVVSCFWDPTEVRAGNIIHTQTCLPWHIGMTYDELMLLQPSHLDSKADRVSWVTSNLNTRPGHSLRLAFLEGLRRRGFDFDLFGRGFHEIDDKFSAMKSYKYSIAIENFSCEDYWTEKIADCFLSWTMPIYFGCTNICSYFPKDSMIQIDPEDVDGSIHRIEEAIAGRSWERNLDAIREARDRILNEYQLFPTVVRRINELNLASESRSLRLIRR
jgi:hypothetical protein